MPRGILVKSSNSGDDSFFKGIPDSDTSTADKPSVTMTAEDAVDGVIVNIRFFIEGAQILEKPRTIDEDHSFLHFTHDNVVETVFDSDSYYAFMSQISTSPLSSYFSLDYSLKGKVGGAGSAKQSIIATRKTAAKKALKAKTVAKKKIN